MRNAARFIGGLLAATVVFEAYLRIAEATPLWHVLPAAEVSLYGPDPYSGYALRPDIDGLWLTENRVRVHTSPQGLRDHDTSYAKPPGVFRIAIAGDSITEALQVDLDETFAVLLEERYKTLGRSVEVVNLGISGAVPAVQLTRMDKVGRRFHPNLMLFIMNVADFASPAMGEDGSFPGYVRVDGGSYRLDYRFREQRSYRFRTGSLGQAYYWAMDHSRVMRVVNARRNQGFGIGAGGNVAPGQGDACGRDRIRALSALASEEWSDSGQQGILSAYFRDVAALANAEGVPAVFALRGLSDVCLTQAGQAENLKRVLALKLAGVGIGLLDLDAGIRAGMSRNAQGKTVRDLYGFGARLGEGHLNQFGHRIYADALEAGMQSWVPVR